jgi:AGCS family alanine or glycine:cation symporter
MKTRFLSLFLLISPFLFFGQNLVVSHVVTDASDEIDTAEIQINVKGGVSPYKYYWSEKNIDTLTNTVNKATEGKEYSLKVIDSNGSSKDYTLKVPVNSFPEILSSSFAPIVGFMDKYFFFDPFHSLGLYDNRVKDESGKILLNPNGTQKLLKSHLWLYG